jgi:hypothetical protein
MILGKQFMSENDIDSEKEHDKNSKRDDDLSPVPEAPSGSHKDSSLSSNDKLIKLSNGKARVKRRKKTQKSFQNSSDKESGANQSTISKLSVFEVDYDFYF